MEELALTIQGDALAAKQAWDEISASAAPVLAALCNGLIEARYVRDQDIWVTRPLRRSGAQRSAAQRSAAQRSAAQCSTAKHSAVQHSIAPRSAAQHSTAQRSAA